MTLHGVLNCLRVCVTKIHLVLALFAVPDIPAISDLQLLPELGADLPKANATVTNGVLRFHKAGSNHC